MTFKELRLELGMTHEQTARLLNVTLSTISRWDRGITDPHPIFIEKLETLLKKRKSKKESA